jgi:hypothetical protein
MRQVRSAPSIVAVFLVLASAAALAADGESRPFSAVIQGNANPVPTEPCILVNTEAGTGTALHAGQVVWTSVEVVNLCSNREGADISGRLVLTAANGDQILGVYQTLAQLDFSANRVTAAGRYRIAGGTGRFAGATGEGDINAVGSLLPPFEVTGTLAGNISF